MSHSCRSGSGDAKGLGLRIMPFLMLCSLLACRSSSAGDVVDKVPLTQRCVVPGAPKVLSDALCAGNASALQRALDSLKERDEAPNFIDVIPIVDRVWLGDRSLGKSLPWEALSRTDVRATIVRNLASQVPLGRSKLSLKDLQSFAVNLSRKDTPLGASEGINLIGFTHAPGQVEFLQRVIAAPTDPSQRDVAISALGMVCEEEAKGALSQMLKRSTEGSEQQKAIKDAIRMRATVSERTCGLASGVVK